MSNTAVTMTKVISASHKASKAPATSTVVTEIDVSDHDVQKGGIYVTAATTTGATASVVERQQQQTTTTTSLTNGYAKALVVTSTFRYEVVHLYSPPRLESEDNVVIQTRTVGLNPIDWKSVDYKFCLPEFPWITGREMAGVVHKVGSKVNGLQVGDRVWTSK
jgi:hypothetical protein